MNYYIQGCAAKADKIKAAFEKLGYEPYCWTFETEFYFTVDCTKTVQIVSSSKLINIIKTHPDYKELELPVEPKFKVGDWVVSPNSSQYLIAYIDKEDNRYLFEIDEYTGDPMHYEDVQVVNSQYHLWTIADAKDGDIIGFNDCTHNDGSYIDWVGIYKQASETNQHLFHCVIPSCRSFRVGGLWRVFTAYPATKEQRDLLFAKMKEAGYQWDADKKELRKIQPHYDIANFKAGMPVLARGAVEERWTYVLFSHSYVGSDGKTHFNAGGWIWNQCIPFNDDTKHLLGTTDQCDEQYINW